MHILEQSEATIHFSPFTCSFRTLLGRSFTVFFATRTPNSQNHSYVHYSLSKFTGEWFTNHSNHIHIFTSITLVATTFWNNLRAPHMKMWAFQARIGDRKGTTKKRYDKEFAEPSGELSDAVCIKSLVLLGNDP